MFERIELITFDLDDTLWPCFPTIQAAETTLYQWLEQHAPALTEQHTIESLREHRLAIAKDNPDRAHDLTEMRLRSLSSLMREFGLAVELAEQANQVFRQARNQVTPFEEVSDVLQRMRERYVLVAVTNGNAQIEHTPLADCFDHSFMAEEVGAAKPAPALFEAARDAAGIELDRAVHVGDDPMRDIEAARLAGMRSVWVNRMQSTWPEALQQADLSVSNLQEFEQFMRRFQ